MPTPRKARHASSPDPILLEDAQDCIQVSLPLPQPPSSARPPLPRQDPTNMTTPLIPRGRKARPLSIESPAAQRRAATASSFKARTPLKKTGGGSNRDTPTPKAGKGKVKEAEEIAEEVNVTPTKRKVIGHERRPSKATPTLGSSITKSLPTPSPAKRARIASPARTPLKPPPLSDPFADGLVGLAESKIKGREKAQEVDKVSREVFLSNEALKKQREARNFVFEGSIEAPTLTRSGKVVGGAPTDGTDEADEYGGEVEDSEEPEHLNVEWDGAPLGRAGELEVTARNGPTEVDPTAIIPDLPPLPLSARPHLRQMLRTLTSAPDLHPRPFDKEETNDALQGVLSLLRGTVERGEGNSALLVGARGVGKTRTIDRALDLLEKGRQTVNEGGGKPVVVRLNGLAQVDDRKAIREMGRQIAAGEGKGDAERDAEEEVDDQGDEEYAPTTLPSHLLALLTIPSPRAIVIIIEEFDLFTEHARQALLYCLLDVVQSVKTGPVESTGRGIAVIGLTSRLDTLLLLEKRVKSRFSHRMWRVVSPLAPGEMGWQGLVKRALVPWDETTGGKGEMSEVGGAKEEEDWKADWGYAVETLLDVDKVKTHMNRLAGLTTDVRILYRPFIPLISQVIGGTLDLLSVQHVTTSILAQVESASWGLALSKLKNLPHPSLGVLIIAKHLSYAGQDDFTFAQVEEEYLRFSRTKLVGSGRVRWPIVVLRGGFEHCVRMGLVVFCGGIAGGAGMKREFRKARKTVGNHEIIGWCKGEGGIGLGPELASWGKMMGGHA